MNNKLVLDLEKITLFETIKQYDFTSESYKNVNEQIIIELLNNEILINNFINILKDKDSLVIDIYLKNQDYPSLKINKISLLNTLLDYITKENIKNIEITRKICLIAITFNYDKIKDKNGSYTINIDENQINIPISYFYNFLTIEDNLYNYLIQNEKYYKGIKIEIFVYALVNYFFKNHFLETYLFPNKIINRFLELKQMQIIDYESINQIPETIDPYLKDVKINSSLEEFLFQEKDENQNSLQYIINTYLKLCSVFTYDEFYYMDPLSDEGIKHSKISNLIKISPENNKIVCFEFTAIFGYFLNKIGIKYKVIQNKSEYGYLHNYIVFRYDKFLVCINPIDSVLRSDLTTVKIGSSLVGIYALNQNNNTKREFDMILNSCYQTRKIDTENEYLPANKIDNNNLDLPSKIKNYLQRIDVVIKKLNQINLPNIDRVTYFKALMKLVFTTNELEINVSECIVIQNSIPRKLVFIITLNEFSYMNLDNYYLIYDGNLRFTSKKDLQELFDTNVYEYLNEKQIPGIKEKSLK